MKVLQSRKYKIVLFALIVGAASMLMGFAGMSDWQYEGLPGEYEFHRSSAFEKTIKGPVEGQLVKYNTVVPAYVGEIAFDERYIFVKKYKYKEDVLDNTLITYYLIDAMEEEVYGPLTGAAFMEQKKSLGIESRIKWMDVDELRSRARKEQQTDTAESEE